MEKRCKHKITRRCVIKEETEELGEKPLHRPPSDNRSTRQSVRIHGLAEDPPSLIYPLYLNPQAPTPTPTRLLGSVFCLTFRIPQYARLHMSKPGFFQYFQAAPNPHLTLWKGVVSVWIINLSMLLKWRGRSWGKSTSKCVEICGYNNL